MRVLIALSACLAVHAQSGSSRSTYTYDSNGRRSLDSASQSSKSGSSESARSLNGGMVALQTVEERVVSTDGSTRVVERIVRRNDGSGRPATTEKHIVEETKGADGGSTVRTTLYEADLSGRFAMRERSTVQTTKSGGVERADAVVERPTLNGSVEAVEKRTTVAQGPESDRQRDTTVYRRGSGGGFEQVEREIEQTKAAGGQSTTTTAVYNAVSTGKLELATQKVATTSKLADGTEVQVVDLYSNAQQGRAAESGAPKLRERQVIERRQAADQSVVETFSIRRPQLDTGKLGPLTRISETVCTGKCKD
jgi:hypothetical protein